MKQVTVKQNPEKPVTVEVMAESITTIAAGVKKLLDGPLNRKAVLLLIQHAAPTYRGQKIGQREISDVLEGIQELERTYLKPKKPKA